MALARHLPAEDNFDFQPGPSQEAALQQARKAIGVSDVVLLEGAEGSGRTSLLKELRRRHGGVYFNAADLMERTVSQPAGRYEQILFEMLRDAFEAHDIIYYDDVRGFQVADHQDNYKRYGRVSAVLRAVRDIAQEHGKCIVFSTDHQAPRDRAKDMARGRNWDDKGILVKIPTQTVDDYRHILGVYLGPDRLDLLEVDRLFAASSRLTAGQLSLLGRALVERGHSHPTFEDALAIVDGEIMHSNVDLDEVEAIQLADMVGVDDIVKRLDRAILLPLRDPDLARELKIEPKHGVLLYGPPGTGKTTVGRALAHQMRGKFFMIDGDFVHDATGFYKKIEAVFEQALRNSPSVIFIDDADVILSDPDMQHFGRFLLTKLDGLQSESMARVCIMMTAMNIASMPAAMIRSGRLEVWLEMRLPDVEARGQMIQSYARRLPFADAARSAENAKDDLAEITDGFTPADLRRLVSDAAGRLGFDRHRQRSEQEFGAYLSVAASELRKQKGLAEDAITARGGRRFY